MSYSEDANVVFVQNHGQMKTTTYSKILFNIHHHAFAWDILYVFISKWSSTCLWDRYIRGNVATLNLYETVKDYETAKLATCCSLLLEEPIGQLVKYFTLKGMASFSCRLD